MGSVYRSLEEVDVSGQAWTRRLPLGPLDGPDAVVHGTLKNGMKYYVRRCSKPKERAALGLAVRVGSVVEADDEQGIAHILEHLAFNATENYSNHDIIKFLESIGAAFGACSNAVTGCDDTQYLLTVPSSDLELLDRALEVMAEFAFKIRCADGDLAKERGAVLEEWRMARDTHGRQQEAHWKLIMEGSRYADRLPIGLESIIRNVPASTVRTFFERWYRPENMALVVCGDIKDTDRLVQSITRHMEGATTGVSRFSTPAQPVPQFGFAPHSEPRYKVFVDKEAQDAMVYVSFKRNKLSMETPEQYLEYLKDNVFQIAMNNRLFRLARQHDGPFFSASAGDEAMCGACDSCVLTAKARDGKTLIALEALLTEVARVRLHGLSEAEVARAIKQMEADVETTYLERNQTHCEDMRDEYIRHFLGNEFVTGQDYESRLCKTLLPMVNTKDVQQRALRYHPTCSAVVKTVEHRKRHSEDALKAVVSRVAAAEAAGTIEPWQQLDAPSSLMPSELPPGAIVSERWYEELQAWEFELGNGMRVCLKSTDFLDDEVMISGHAHGGLSQVPQERFYTAVMSTLIAAQMGPYGHKPEVLNDILAGKRIELDFNQGAYSRFFKGNTSPHDLTEAMQLIHLLFTTELQAIPEETARVMALVAQSIEAQLRNPVSAYHARVRQINYNDCYYFRPITMEALANVDPSAALAHHSAAFRNPAQYTVVFTGNISKAQLTGLIEQYLASLPARDSPARVSFDKVEPLPYAFPEAPVVEDVHVEMVAPLTQSQISFPVVLRRATVREEVHWISLACKLLETRLLQVLRFKFGEIYTVSVSPFFGCVAPSSKGDLHGDVAITFTCDPNARERLVELALVELETLQEAGPSQQECDTLLNLERLQWENEQAENGYWHEIICSSYSSRSFEEHKELDAVYIKKREAREHVLATFSPSELHGVLRRMLPYPCRSRYTAITMVPKPPGLLSQLVMTLASSPYSRYIAAAGVLAVAAAVVGWRRQAVPSSRR